jgi:hypothetical protein
LRGFCAPFVARDQISRTDPERERTDPQAGRTVSVRGACGRTVCEPGSIACYFAASTGPVRSALN